MLSIFRYFTLFRRRQDGIAYVEFALCLPFMIALLMGGIEITRLILVEQKLEKVAVTISDVTSQGQTISTAELNNIILAAGQIMRPYTFTTNGYVIITAVTQTGAPTVSNQPKVNWQYKGGGTMSPTPTSHIGSIVGSNATLPTGFSLNDKDNVIITEVFYNFTPLITNNGIIGNRSIYKLGLYKPRLGALSTLGFLQPAIFIGAVL